jgi:nucleotide-binding universal stress UspA family protein
MPALDAARQARHDMTTDRELIVVGVDGSAESVGALTWASRYAAACGGRIRALLAWRYPSAVGPAPPGVAPESVTDEVRASMTEQLSAAVAEGAPGADVEPMISYGHAAQILVDASAEADLLVVGSRGRGAFTGMLVGSVSLHVVNHAHCPVVVVRRGTAPPEPPQPA